MITLSSQSYGRSARNRIEEVRESGINGAQALVETFYHAFNQRDLALFTRVWADHALIQLNNPLGGLMRGHDAISALYQRIFTGPARVWVELSDIVEYQTNTMVVFAGRERGEFSHNGVTLALNIRTSRITQWMGEETGWRQVHHHGSIDDPLLLRTYQSAVK